MNKKLRIVRTLLVGLLIAALIPINVFAVESDNAPITKQLTSQPVQTEK